LPCTRRSTRSRYSHGLWATVRNARSQRKQKSAGVRRGCESAEQRGLAEIATLAIAVKW
jgi:hypothetical protein